MYAILMNEHDSWECMDIRDVHRAVHVAIRTSMFRLLRDGKPRLY